MSDRHDVLNTSYWSARARHMRELTATASDDTSRAAYLRLMQMYERLAGLTRADHGPGAPPGASVPLLTRRAQTASKSGWRSPAEGVTPPPHAARETPEQ